MISLPSLGLAGGAFLLGCRHGFDWDHMAAITDLTTAGGPAGSEDSPPAGGGDRSGHAPHARGGGGRVRRVGLAFWYCLGHGSVIVLFGLAIVGLGLHIPSLVDRIFESVVGATLVALGGVVLWQLGRDRSGYRYSGRVRLLVGAVRRAWARARRRGAGPAEPLQDLNGRSAFAVGVLHGTGAETPTQVLLFAGAATSGSRMAAVLLMAAFVGGMILADLGIAASWLAGILGIRSAPKAQIILGGLTGLSSLTIGALFMAGRSAILPALFGG